MFKNFDHLQLSAKKAVTNSADTDQNASEEVVLSGSSLLAILTSILWIQALLPNDFFENRNQKVFVILNHLP